MLLIIRCFESAKNNLAHIKYKEINKNPNQRKINTTIMYHFNSRSFFLLFAFALLLATSANAATAVDDADGLDQTGDSGGAPPAAPSGSAADVLAVDRKYLRNRSLQDPPRRAAEPPSVDNSEHGNQADVSTGVLIQDLDHAARTLQMMMPCCNVKGFCGASCPMSECCGL